MRSAAEGEHRTGEDVGEAVPLMPLEAIQPFGKGEVKGNARRACPRSQSGKNRRGMQPEGGCPSEARRVPRWRQIGAIEADPLSPKGNPAEAGCVRYRKAFQVCLRCRFSITFCLYAGCQPPGGRGVPAGAGVPPFT